MKKYNTQNEIIELDKLVKVLFKLSKKVVLNLLNSLFNENYKLDEVTMSYTNSEFIDDHMDRIYGDLFLMVRTKERLYNYHIEFQTLNDNSMAMRMFRYGFENAIELSANTTTDEIVLHYPKQLVIFIEENENIKDELVFVLKLPDGQDIRFTVPVMKYWKYSPEELRDKKMYALLPLQVFNLRKRIRAIYNSNRKDAEKINLINGEFENLINTIKKTIDILEELYNSNEIVGRDLDKILRVVNNISEYLYNKYGDYRKVGKEVEFMLKTLNTPAIRREARREARRETTIEIAMNLLDMGMAVVLIAKATGMSEDEVLRLEREKTN